MKTDIDSYLKKNRSKLLFNSIAPIYVLFYRSQMKNFEKVLKKAGDEIDLEVFHNVLDVGCGTGALCAVLRARGLFVIGVEQAERMLEFARKQTQNAGVTFVNANVLDRLPFEDKHFDLSIASFVAHGLQKEERKRMYTEMSRVTRHKVIIHDYNQERRLLTTIIEWMEKGDYFQFIKDPHGEIQACIIEMKKCFSDVKVINVGDVAAWYICSPS